MEVDAIVKCSRCGVEFNPAKAKGCVDVAVNHKTEGEIGFEFVVENHGNGEERSFATLCLNCLGDWLQECGMDEANAKEIVEMYTMKKKVEGTYVVV